MFHVLHGQQTNQPKKAKKTSHIPEPQRRGSRVGAFLESGVGVGGVVGETQPTCGCWQWRSLPRHVFEHKDMQTCTHSYMHTHMHMHMHTCIDRYTFKHSHMYTGT